MITLQWNRWIDDWRKGWAGPAILLVLSGFWLLMMGTIFVHSAADGPETGFPGPYASSHLKKIIVGVVAMLAVSLVHPRRFRQVAQLFFAASVALLALLLLWKWATGAGVVRWIRFGGIGLQPSELAKISMVLILADLIRPGEGVGGWRPIARWVGFASIPFLLVAAQPDLGTALILIPTAAMMLWVAGVSVRRFVLLMVLAVVIGGPASWPLLRDYQKDRILSYVGFGEVSGESEGGYQVAQSIIAIGSGGPTGKGLHMGSHHDLGYVPEDHNDFIFSVIGEELGLIGTLSVVVGYLILVWTMLGVAWNCREPFGRLVAVGLASQIGFQAAINLSMTVGLIPVTGLPLPFVSYGGTSIVVSLAALGIVVSIARNPVEVIHPDGLGRGSSEVTHRPIRAKVVRT